MTFTGTVIHGTKHGRTLGYPTMNMEVSERLTAVLGQHGVYAVSVLLGGKEYCGALFWGVRSLFAETEPVCEIAVLDFSGEAYGEPLLVEVISFIRPAMQVTDPSELSRMIKKDLIDVKKAYAISRG
ncbi:MAG: riboflavin kinase [Patescibacteria group bacterium]|nr:riboflavin kinase [bacterium]MDZ4221771.1 riboflavin kinase [Patescibacteria group bacterium]